MNLRRIFTCDKPGSIRAIEIPPVVNIVVVAPHPDDFDAVGITLDLLRKQGCRIRAGIVSTGSGVDHEYCPGSSLSDRASIRKGEQERSLRFFGLPDSCVTFLDLERDTADQPIVSQYNRDALQSFLTSRKADIFILPHGNDTNSGHRSVYFLVRSILSESKEELLMLLNRDPKTIDMRIDLYTPFGGVEAKWKAEMLRFHDSQHQRNLRTRGHGFDDRILNINRQTATELGLDADCAEAFEMEFLSPDTPLA